jgi:hypothetical protein
MENTAVFIMNNVKEKYHVGSMERVSLALVIKFAHVEITTLVLIAI